MLFFIIFIYSPIFTFFFFFFNDTATTEIYTLSLHDALPISGCVCVESSLQRTDQHPDIDANAHLDSRSEEHTSELQSQSNLVCRLLLEKKKKTSPPITYVQNRYLYNTPISHHA